MRGTKYLSLFSQPCYAWSLQPCSWPLSFTGVTSYTVYIFISLSLICTDFCLNISNQRIQFWSAILPFTSKYIGLLVIILYYWQTVNMGRTKSQSQSSSSSSTRSVPYELPENKTVAQMKVELSFRGIEFPSNVSLNFLDSGKRMKTTSRPNDRASPYAMTPCRKYPQKQGSYK